MKQDSPPGEDSRVGWASAKPGRAHHSHPSWGFFSHSDQAWSTIEKVEEIALKHGEVSSSEGTSFAVHEPSLIAKAANFSTVDLYNCEYMVIIWIIISSYVPFLPLLEQIFGLSHVYSWLSM